LSNIIIILFLSQFKKELESEREVAKKLLSQTKALKRGIKSIKCVIIYIKITMFRPEACPREWCNGFKGFEGHAGKVSDPAFSMLPCKTILYSFVLSTFRLKKRAEKRVLDNSFTLFTYICEGKILYVMLL